MVHTRSAYSKTQRAVLFVPLDRELLEEFAGTAKSYRTNPQTSELTMSQPRNIADRLHYLGDRSKRKDDRSSLETTTLPLPEAVQGAAASRW
jgi:hypothetical protein